VVISSTAWGTSSWIDDRNLIWASTITSGVSPDSVLYQLCNDGVYVYVAHSTGVSIIDLKSEDLVCKADEAGGFNSIAVNNTTVYLGTYCSGVYFFNKSSIYGTKDFIGNIESDVHSLSTSYLPSSQEISNLSIYDTDLAIVTPSGLDVIGTGPGKEFKSSTTSSGITKSFLTSKKEIYYIEYSDEWSLCKTKPYLCDWEAPTIRYTIGASFLEWEVELNDLFITEGTSSNGVDNTIFLTTTSGIYVYDEGTSILDLYLHNI
jgi:hypothetical protein